MKSDYYKPTPAATSFDRYTRCDSCGALHSWCVSRCSNCGGFIYKGLRTPSGDAAYRRHIQKTVSRLWALIDAGHRPKVFIAIKCE
jgi:hypothetical protein